MKWVFVLMVLTNVGFAVWRTGFSEPQATESVAAVTLPSHINRLLLIGELEEERLRERDGSAGETTEPTTVATVLDPDDNGSSQAAPSTTSCYSIGPLDNSEQVDRVGAWLVSLGGRSVLRVSERREISRFWVYFPPFPNRAEAIERVEQMVEANIEDIYVIPRGDMANAISLGLYSHESSLQRRLTELRSNGYDPSFAPRFESKKASWYDVTFDRDFDYPMEAFGDAFPGLEATANHCG